MIVIIEKNSEILMIKEEKISSAEEVLNTWLMNVVLLNILPNVLLPKLFSWKKLSFELAPTSNPNSQLLRRLFVIIELLLELEMPALPQRLS